MTPSWTLLPSYPSFLPHHLSFFPFSSLLSLHPSFFPSFSPSVLPLLFIPSYPCPQAGFAHFKPSVSYGANAIGQVMFGFTYLLDLVLLLDVIVSMKKAVVTSTGVCVCVCVCLYYCDICGSPLFGDLP